MINGNAVDYVNYACMLRSLQRMQELDDTFRFYFCDKGQLLTDFVKFEGVLPAPEDCVVTLKPIRNWANGKDFQWFCRIKDEDTNQLTYFTIVRP